MAIFQLLAFFAKIALLGAGREGQKWQFLRPSRYIFRGRAGPFLINVYCGRRLVRFLVRSCKKSLKKWDFL